MLQYHHPDPVIESSHTKTKEMCCYRNTVSFAFQTSGHLILHFAGQTLILVTNYMRKEQPSYGGDEQQEANLRVD